MRPASQLLCDYLADKFQIAGNAPAVMVFFRQRYWDRPDLWNGSEIKTEWYQLTNRVISVEVQESVEQFASSFTITLSNEEGELSPDNYTGKWPLDIKFRGHERITYASQLYPNNEIKVYLGYGDELVPFIHGFINDAKMSADGQTIIVSAMTSYKKILHQTIKESVLKAPDGNLYDVVKFFFDKAGVTLHGQKMYVPGTNIEWKIKKFQGTKGQSYDEVIRQLIDTTFHYIKSNPDGSCTLMPIPTFHMDDPADVILDEFVNLTSLEYTVTDQDINSVVTVKCGNFSNTFINRFLLDHVCLGHWREEIIDVPWADTYFKRKAAALANHVQNLHKWRTMNVGIVGDPRLQLWDRVGIREQTSSQTWVFHIKGIQTMISETGFFQVLDLSANYGLEMDIPSDLSPIQVNVDTIRLKLWDWDVEDGDLVNIYCNDNLVVKNYKIKNNATYVDIPLMIGNNIIVFEGVRTPKGILTGRLQVLDTQNHILFDVGSLPDLTFPRTNVNKDGYYTKRPSKTWVVARIN